MNRYFMALFLVVLCLPFSSVAEDNYKFRVYLIDKPIAERQQPELSQKSMARRQKFNISLDETDYAVSAEYCRKIASLYPIVSKSRWMNTVVISAADVSCVDILKKFSFVKEVSMVWKSSSLRNASENRVQKWSKWEASVCENSVLSEDVEKLTDIQLNMLGGNLLHQAGFKGQGMTIAVIDAGFSAVDWASNFSDVKIVDVRNFCNQGGTVYNNGDHGAAVLSIMACQNDSFMGTAPEAEYVLLCSEDGESEYPVEEDYWAAAAEYADSLGVDVVNTSLSYFKFDDETLNYTHSQLDGKSIFISCASEIAAQKGMLLVNSAGNEGDDPWGKITAPADAPSALAVGSVNPWREYSYFSSLGPTADGRIKPDVMAMGSFTCLYNKTSCEWMSGTSFSAPLVAGMSACLWQALPSLTPGKLRDLIRSSGDRAANPDTVYGYGIPDFYQAWLSVGISEPQSAQIVLYPNPVKDFLSLYLPENTTLVIGEIYDMCGRLVFTGELSGTKMEWDISHLPPAVYVLRIVQGNTLCLREKFIKSE